MTEEEVQMALSRVEVSGEVGVYLQILLGHWCMTVLLYIECSLTDYNAVYHTDFVKK